MKMTHKHFSVSYIRSERIAFEGELPRTQNQTVNFESDEAEARAFLENLLADKNEFWRIDWAELITRETYENWGD